MKHLADGMKYLPKNLKDLTLNLYKNNIGTNIEFMKYLGDGIK